MKNLIVLSILCATAFLLFGCDPGELIAPQSEGRIQDASSAKVASTPAMHKRSGCHAVRGTISAQLIPGGATGTIDGDLQGPINTTLSPEPVGNTDMFMTGKVIHVAGEQTIEVTGSSVDELVGRTIVWTLQGRSIFQPPIRRINSTLRITEGAQSGNLVSHGILDLTTLTTQFDYEGVICP